MVELLRGLSQQERIAIVIAVAFLAFLLLYVFAWRPLSLENHRLKDKIIQQQDDLAWFDRITAEVSKLKLTQRPQSTNETSLLSLLDESARRFKLSKAVQRIEPQRNKEIRIQLKQAAFNHLINWLEHLESKGLSTAEISVMRVKKKSGYVDAIITLKSNL